MFAVSHSGEEPSVSRRGVPIPKFLRMHQPRALQAEGLMRRSPDGLETSAGTHPANVLRDVQPRHRADLPTDVPDVDR